MKCVERVEVNRRNRAVSVGNRGAHWGGYRQNVLGVLGMGSAIGFRTFTCWLLAVAISAQPVTGAFCACNVGDTEAVQCRVEPGGCGCAHHGRARSRFQPTCCGNGPESRDGTPAACACNCCEQSVPAAPLAPDGERPIPTDLARPAPCAVSARVDIHLMDSFTRFFRLPSSFESASEHCVSLCRLLL